MSLVVQNNGEGDMLAGIVGKTACENLVLRLFKSNTTPAEADTAATYTEADFTGYSAVTLTASSWTVTEGAPSHADYPQVTFTSSAGSQSQAVYGYYLTRVSSGRIAWAERFADGPYTIVNSGDAIKVTAVISLD